LLAKGAAFRDFWAGRRRERLSAAQLARRA